MLLSEDDRRQMDEAVLRIPSELNDLLTVLFIVISGRVRHETQQYPAVGTMYHELVREVDAHREQVSQRMSDAVAAMQDARASFQGNTQAISSVHDSLAALHHAVQAMDHLISARVVATDQRFSALEREYADLRKRVLALEQRQSADNEPC
jgi:chromosome segregation ATPase